MSALSPDFLTKEELEALNYIGFHPENLPSTLDDFIIVFLRDRADVEVSPTTAAQMTGRYEAILGAGIASALTSQGGSVTTAAYTAGSIKEQTQVQEWIHWKKFALESPEFDRWRDRTEERFYRMYEAMKEYIRSSKGKGLIKWIEGRNGGVGIVWFAPIIAQIAIRQPWVPLVFIVPQLLLRAGGPNGLGHLVALRVYKIDDIENLMPRAYIDDAGELLLEY